MKTCSRCGAEKPVTAYYLRGPGLGPRSVCKSCVAVHNAAYRALHRDEARPYMAAYYRANRERARLAGWRARIGKHVTADVVASLARAQGPHCAICLQHVNEMPSTWHLDHCHTTGQLRGFLCPRCNLLLGHARERPEILRAAALYLEKIRIPEHS